MVWRWIAFTLSLCCVDGNATEPPHLSSAKMPASAKIQVGKTELDVELARTPLEQKRGLMFRQELSEGKGMLFEFPDETVRFFWMKNTLISLTIGYFNAKKVLAVAGAIFLIDATQRLKIVAVPAPRNAFGFQLPDERSFGVNRRLLVVLAAGGMPGHGVQSIRPGRSRRGAKPAITNAEISRQMIVHRQILGVVITHDFAGIGGGIFFRKVADEPAVAVAELLGDVAGFMPGVFFHSCRIETANFIFLAVILVEHFIRQAIDFFAAGLELQIAEHVIEGTILQHEHDDMIDLAQVVLNLFVKTDAGMKTIRHDELRLSFKLLDEKMPNG